MKVAQLVLEYLKTLVWPSIVIAMVFVFRREMRALMQGRLTAKYKELEITLEREIEVKQRLVENQQVVLQHLGAAAARLPSSRESTDVQNEVATIRESVMVLEATLGRWESLVIAYLRQHDTGASRGDVIRDLTNDSDAMSMDTDEAEVERALDHLEAKSIIASADDKTLRLHTLLRQGKRSAN